MAMTSWTSRAVVLVLSLAFPALAQHEPEPDSGIDPEAMQSLMRMAERLAGSQRFSFTARVGYDAVQDDGLKVEFGGVRRATVRRPDRVRLLFQRRDGDTGGMLFDGQRITLFSDDDRVYAQVGKTGTVDAMFDYLIEELDTPMPLHELVSVRLPDLLRERVREAARVGYVKLGDTPCEHLAVRGDEVDVQFWIEEGESALPRRLVITYREAPGQPQYRADLDEWNLDAEAPDALFHYEPPDGYQQIRFLAQDRPASEAR